MSILRMCKFTVSDYIFSLIPLKQFDTQEVNEGVRGPVLNEFCNNCWLHLGITLHTAVLFDGSILKYMLIMVLRFCICKFCSFASIVQSSEFGLTDNRLFI